MRAVAVATWLMVIAVATPATQSAPARVQFTRTLTPASERRRPSALARLARLIVGGGEAPAMTQPHGAVADATGRLFVADGGTHSIHVFGRAAGDYRTIRVDSDSLIGIALLGDRLVVTDSVGDRVICLDQRGKVQWSLGKRDGFERPTGIVAAGDRLFVVDTMRGRIVMVSARGIVGESFGRRGKSDGELNFPTHIASDGRLLYVNDTLNFRMQVFDLDGRFVRAFGQLGDAPGDFDKPKGIAVDGSGHIYVADALRDFVQVFDSEGRLLMVFGSSGDGPGELWLPAGVAISGPTVFVVDAANRRVQVYERFGDAR